MNRTDCGFRAPRPCSSGLSPGWCGRGYRILGNEFAGDVEAVGPAVTTFAVGDRVFGYDDGAWGGHAEYRPSARRLAGPDTRRPDLPTGRAGDGGLALRAGEHHEGEHPRRATGPGQRRHRARSVPRRSSCWPARGVHVTGVCDDRAPRPRARARGRAGDRPHRGRLHPGRRGLRRRVRRGREELVRPVPAAAHPARRLPVHRPRPARPEPAPGARHSAVARPVGRCSASRGTTRR